LSKFSKYNKKSKKLEEGFIIISNAGINFTLSEVFEKEAEKYVILSTPEIELVIPARDVVENVRNGTWRLKEGPLEPEKFLKKYNFI
jgi:hypothetical protein